MKRTLAGMSDEFADYVRRHTALGLAKRLGVAHTTVLRWVERGIPPNRLAEVSRATGIPAEALRPDLAAAFARNESATAGGCAILQRRNHDDPLQ